MRIWLTIGIIVLLAIIIIPAGTHSSFPPSLPPSSLLLPHKQGSANTSASRCYEELIMVALMGREGTRTGATVGFATGQ